MGGGLLNIVSTGSSNILLYNNPKMSIFKTTYKSITNFGIQRIRLDCDGNKEISLTQDRILKFKVKRHAEMLGDCYFVCNLPDIWSPLMRDPSGAWAETGFRWIKEIGTNMIREVSIEAGGQTLAKYTGEYFSYLAHRDSHDKLNLWKQMTGDVPELHDPGYAYGRKNVYPSVFLTKEMKEKSETPEPSIRGKKLYIPLNMWFTQSPSKAIPLVALQYLEIYIYIHLRPIKELCLIRDIRDHLQDDYQYPLIAPNFSISEHQIYRYLYPPNTDGSNNNLEEMHTQKTKSWNTDAHIMATYYFLTDDEAKSIAKKDYRLLVRDVFFHNAYNYVGSNTYRIDSRGLVSSLIVRFRRSDAFTRNEWSNYTNWPYESLPYNISLQGTPDERYCTTGTMQIANKKDILEHMTIAFDGKQRENTLDAGVFHYIEPYSRTRGNGRNGIYTYEFGSFTSANEYQPYGGMNVDKYDKIELIFKTITPPLYFGERNVRQICDTNGRLIAIDGGDINQEYEYSYDISIMEERYNVLQIKSGMISLLFAR